jgi:transglutaminase-like putative cysteine protease
MTPKSQPSQKKNTNDCQNNQDKVEAILKWLTPGKNIVFGGPVEGSRWGVKKVLKQGFGQCWDFADCFITLCRASGIPCRQLAGWLYGCSGHIWAEILIEGKGWQQVDPTGGSVLKCGIYHIPYFTSEDGNMPILYVSMPRIEMLDQ